MIAVAAGEVQGPHIDFAGLSPIIALLGGAIVVLLVGPARGRVRAPDARAGARRSPRWRPRSA